VNRRKDFPKSVNKLTGGNCLQFTLSIWLQVDKSKKMCPKLTVEFDEKVLVEKENDFLVLIWKCFGKNVET
jgi:hypothetical protein